MTAWQAGLTYASNRRTFLEIMPIGAAIARDAQSEGAPKRKLFGSLISMNSTENSLPTQTDVLLIGAGIMSATLAVMLCQMQPDWTIQLIERLDGAAAESSDAWNNAGTGHAAFCELNYTPEKEDGTIAIDKAIGICESFDESRQFWSFLIEQGMIQNPRNFIRQTPHLAFVWGADDVDYLRKRYQAMHANPLFGAMEYSEEAAQLTEWMPLVMEGREPEQKVAATRMKIGTDVNFGALTRAMIEYLRAQNGVDIAFSQAVIGLHRENDGRWKVTVKDEKTGKVRQVSAQFVFIGAGGWSLPLLIKSGIPESHGYGGFPVSGQWLKCTNPEVIEKHEAKVYGKAAVGAPPMSVPHLDTRVIDGQKALLFGPYAGFSTKFLKQGSFLDLPLSIRPGNIFPMLSVGRDNIPLTKYLIDQVRQSPEDRLAALRDFLPMAQLDDWELEVAGQRVQIIKKDPKRGGTLQFGTEVVSAADGSLAALLGASPGASTTVSIMMTLMKQCFPDQFKSDEWQSKIKAMVPSFGQKLAEDGALVEQVRERTAQVLELG